MSLALNTHNAAESWLQESGALAFCEARALRSLQRATQHSRQMLQSREYLQPRTASLIKMLPRDQDGTLRREGEARTSRANRTHLHICNKQAATFPSLLAYTSSPPTP